jgi:DNA-directed RNA polymerase specialized sigma24 family protein
MAVRQALASLKQIDRQVCILHDVVGFTHHEIGAALRIPESTSKSKLASARRQLRGYVRFRSPQGEPDCQPMSSLPRLM